MSFENPPETPQPASNEVPKKKPDRLAAVALAASALFPQSIEELPQPPEDKGESALTKKSLDEYLEGAYIKAEYGPTKDFTLEGAGESKLSSPKVSDPDTKKDIVALSVNFDYLDKNDAFQLEAWQRIIDRYGEDLVRKFVDFIASDYLKMDKTREEKLQIFEKICSLTDNTEMLEKKFYQIAAIIEAGRYDDMKKILESLRTLGDNPQKTPVTISQLTPEWLAVLSNPEEQKALVFINTMLPMGAAHKIEAAGLAKPGKFSDLRPSEQVRVYIVWLRDQKQRESNKQE